MNTIHSVSDTSLVRSSEAVAVCKSFSFRSLMMRVMMVMAIVVGSLGIAKGQDVVYKTLTFSSSYNSQGISSYANSWYVTINSDRWNMVNFNNNNNGWNYVKAGTKNNASIATITTNAAYQEAITKVEVKVDAVTASSINSTKLYVASNSSFTADLQTITLAPSTGTMTYTIPNPTANRFYKLEYNCKKGSSNGLITISKVVYYKQASVRNIVTFIAGSGSCDYTSIQETSAGSGVILPSAIPSDDCSSSYTFYGWSTDEVETETTSVPIIVGKNGDSYFPAEDIELYAVYKKIRNTYSEKAYDFSEIPGFSSWGNSYSERAVNYDVADVIFESASKQTSIITNIPVTKGNYVSLVLRDSDNHIEEVSFECQKWNTNTQTITLHYSTDGGSSYTTTETTSDTFTISNDELNASTNAVKITFSSIGSQVGVSSCTIKVQDVIYNTYPLCNSATITYDANGATTGTAPTDPNSPYTLVNGQKNIELLYNTGNLVKTGYTFDGWNTTADGSGISYSEGGTFTLTENTVLYAKWTPNRYTVVWLANGLSLKSYTYNYGEYIEEEVPEDAEANDYACEGKVFVGWSESSFDEYDGTPALIQKGQIEGTQVTSSKTYYAVFATDNGITNKYLLYSGTLTEGDYVIYYSGKAMKNTVSNSRLEYESVTPSNDIITTTNTAIIWHIEQNGIYWTIYNAAVNKYAASNGTKNQAQMLADGTNDKSLWSASGTSTYEFVNKHNVANSVNDHLRGNGTYGFACYGTGTGGSLSLYKKGNAYSNYTTFCPCNYGTIPGIANGDFVWAGKNAEAPLNDWKSKDNWVVYNSTEDEFHLTGSAPEGNKVFILNKTDECGIDAIPTLASNVTCNNITLSSNMGINLGEYDLTVTGNLTNDGSAITGTGKMIFAGTSAQAISGATTFNNVEFNNSNGITASTEPTINGTATFTSGVINGNVTFGSSATVSGASTSSYVNGKVTKNGMSGAFTFPTGTASLYAPFEASSSEASNVSVQYAAGSEGMPDWWNHSGNLYNAGLHHASDRENWQISANASTVLSNIKLCWNAAADNYHSFEEDASDLNSYLNVAVVKKGGFFWQNLGKAEIYGSFSGSGSITAAESLEITVGAKAAGDGEYFATFASSNSNVVLPIELISFTATCNGKSSLIEWTTATEKNNDFFVLERSNDAVNFKEIARVAGAGNSIEPINYAYTDYGARSGDNYYRLVQVDYDGTSTASEIIVANCPAETLGEPDVLAFPNPFDDNLTLHFENFGNKQATVEVYDMLGRMVHTQKVNCSQNDYEVVLRLAGLSDGTYNVRISSKELVINKKVAKQ